MAMTCVEDSQTLHRLMNFCMSLPTIGVIAIGMGSGVLNQ